MSAKKDKKKKKPKGRIIVTSITADILKIRSDNSPDMTEEEIHEFAMAVFK